MNITFGHTLDGHWECVCGPLGCDLQLSDRTNCSKRWVPAEKKRLLGPLLSGEYMVTDHSYQIGRSTSVITGELRRLDGVDLVRLDLKFYVENSRDGRVDLGGRYRITVEPIDHASCTDADRKAPPLPEWVMKAARARRAWGKHQNAKAAEMRNGTMNRDVWDSFAEVEKVLTAEHGYLRDALVLARDPFGVKHARADALVLEEENARLTPTPKAAPMAKPVAVGDAEVDAAVKAYWKHWMPHQAFESEVKATQDLWREGIRKALEAVASLADGAP